MRHRSTGLWIVRDVRVPFRRGKVTTIAGRSGSGKSLTALALAGELPTSMAASFGSGPDGLSVYLLPQGLQENYAPGLDVADYLRGVGCKEAEFPGLLAQVGLELTELQHSASGRSRQDP